MRTELVLRFDYGASLPWVVRLDEWLNGITAIAGPNHGGPAHAREVTGRDMATVAEFVVEAGETIPLCPDLWPLPSARAAAIRRDCRLRETEAFWREWSGRCTYQGEWRDAVMRSLITLKALTFEATGGIVAAATTSLPEQLGGQRNWDYRICWLRDATLTLLAMMGEAIMKKPRRGVTGCTARWRAVPSRSRSCTASPANAAWRNGSFPGCRATRGPAPVRVGNAAADQLQLDVYGEVMDALHQARKGGLSSGPASWTLQVNLIEQIIKIWDEPDEGIWEVRGGRRKFTFSKVMAWVALDRAVTDAEAFNLPGPLEHWREVRACIHAPFASRDIAKKSKHSCKASARRIWTPACC